RQSILRSLADRYGAPLDPMTSWAMAGDMARSGLVEFGCHTVSHPVLSGLSEESAARELTQSRRAIEAALARPVELLAYPYGDSASVGPREQRLAQSAGYAAAVTTRKGTLSLHALDERYALPRLPLNGNFQRLEFIDLFLAGVPFAFGDVARRFITGQSASAVESRRTRGCGKGNRGHFTKAPRFAQLSGWGA